MNLAWHGLLVLTPELLAGGGRYVHMGRRFRRGGSDIDLADVMAAVSVIALVAALAWLATRVAKHRETLNASSPQRLFRELCHAHRLNWSNRKLMQAIAKAHELGNPAMLFVTPQCFALDSLPPSFRSQRAHIEDLKDQLFGTGGNDEHR